MKPRLREHYRIRFEPPGDSGDERLVFTSESKRVVVKGRSFREFVQEVAPLLDGHHALEDIHEQLADVFPSRDIDACIALLWEQRLIEDAAAVEVEPELERTLAPQLNYFREVSGDPASLQERLADATVTVVGLGPLGAVASVALAASGVGHVRCIDDSSVTPTDPFLSQIFDRGDVGGLRIDAVRARIAAIASTTTVEGLVERFETDDLASAAIAGSNFVLCCLDAGLASFAYRLNRACLNALVPSCSASVSAFEGIVGPTVLPFETACYLCYQMRSVACKDDPEDAFADLKDLDRRKRDDSPRRENLAFGAGIVGDMLALEAFKFLLDRTLPTAGRIVTVDFAELKTETHVVLRKPWCPACGGGTPGAGI